MTSPAEDYDSYLDAVLIGGRESASVVIADHDATWPERFAQLQRRVERALPTTALSVEHIGSTSVPGLAAKPIIDMLLTVRSVDDEAAYVDALEKVGFVLRVREPRHRMFRTPARDVHLHVYEPGGQAVADYLDLRDWLRESGSDRALYEATKRELARREWSDMNHYADAKSDVVQVILRRARAWRSGTGR
ncbi:GrpB family protein [Blastococcus saxobsidens]|uniref:GrpB family protein n=1 Tax=Blastococcus saxobsidens TaxID=138336 RepID=A0A6L9W577_9ACTN|nr:GrpB family protein [Blastococcus saxobsidens]